MIRLLLALLLLPCAVFGASTRAELIFNIQSALKTQNSAALAQCFNFDSADDTTRKAYARIIKNMCTWPDPVVQTSERDGTGQIKMTKDGRPVHLNGDWTFQVHLYANPDKKQGFVFPAGQVRGDYYILLAIPD